MDNVIDFQHISVLLGECIEYLNIKSDGTYVDCTLGGAGHSSEILKIIGKGGLLIGLDQDSDAIQVAQGRLASVETSADFKLLKTNFEFVDDAIDQLGIESVDGILMDIGVSSFQLDEAKRGFSYQHDAMLDMRMDKDSPFSAYNVVNEFSKEELTEIIYKYGEENWAKRIAEFIVEQRKDKPIRTTGELVEVIKKAVPSGARRNGPHPAKRTFQAIRIQVNDELGVLERAIDRGFEKLSVGGRMCIITFHSLEDRIVKQKFADLARGCICPPEFPTCVCGRKPRAKVITRKPVLPSKRELEINPRSRSAKLRVIEKIDNN